MAQSYDMRDPAPIYHTWSDAYCWPGIQEVFDVLDMNSFFVEAFIAGSQTHAGRRPAYLSLECGDGAVEIGIAKTLVERGITHFRFVACDRSETQLARFRAAIPADLTDHFELRTGELNPGEFAHEFNVIMANHSLHQMVALEEIVKAAYEALTSDGVFVTADMIGRNGHMRWPETRLFVDFFWPFLSHAQRRNVVLTRSEMRFLDHDCSNENFEGIRSQDVLPLVLRQGFHPWKFFAFGGIADVFVGQFFGPNFDVANAADVFLIRRIGLLNQILLDLGAIKPTIMMAYFTKRPCEEIHYRNRTAQAAIRDSAADPAWLSDALADLVGLSPAPEFTFRPALTPVEARLDEIVRRLERMQIGSAPNRETQRRPDDMVANPSFAQSESARLKATIATLTMRVQAMERSTSWRITAPLRALVHRLARRPG